MEYSKNKKAVLSRTERTLLRAMGARKVVDKKDDRRTDEHAGGLKKTVNGLAKIHWSVRWYAYTAE